MRDLPDDRRFTASVNLRAKILRSLSEKATDSGPVSAFPDLDHFVSINEMIRNPSGIAETAAAS
jgi:hypothetical protein